MDCIKVALFGFGTIGTGVAKILLNHAQRISQATGKEVQLVRICDKDLTTVRDVALPDGILTDQAETIFSDPSIQIGIELIGGIEPARSFVIKLLESGKDVVTANKALLAAHGPELFEIARKHGRTIAFEAAVCGGIPIISALSTALQANEIQSITAIANGTCNYILSQMESGKVAYSEAVAQAQALGYAEADPTMDVDGTDTVQKLSILAQLGFGAGARWAAIPRSGIESVDSIDFKYAKELGYRIKLLAVARRSDEGLELHVCPTLVKLDNPLARVRDAFNAVRIVGDAVGPVFFQGLGAGQLPTASAVVGDVIDTVLGRTAQTFQALELWSSSRPGIAIRESDDFYGESYLRFNVADQPGVLHEVSGVFGEEGISVAHFVQHPSTTDAADEEKQAVLILTTHFARDGQLRRAIDKLENLPSVFGPVVRMRVLNS